MKTKCAAAPSPALWFGSWPSWGSRIQHGDVLLVLEAMKMETNITAPVAGKIAAISVNPGDSVKAGQVVVELE